MRAPFFKPVLFLISFIVLVSVACGLSGQPDPTATPVAPVQVEEVEEVVEQQPVELATEIETSEPEPVFTATTAPSLTPTAEPTQEVPEEAPAYFVEDFDTDIDSWSYFLMNGDENKMDLYTENSSLVFDLQGDYQYVYVLYDEYIYPEVRIDALAANLGKNTNNVSLVCNYSDNFGWYEFNVTNGGLYYILVYSEIDGDYFTLASGGSTNVRTGRNENTYSAVCNGNQLALYINGVLEREYVDNVYNLSEGQVGISVSSFEVLPILVAIDYFSISLP